MPAAVMFWLTVHLWLAPPVNLAHAAARESVRRARLPPAVTQLTDADFPDAPAPLRIETPASSTSMTPPARDEQWWRTRVQQAREALARDDSALKALEAELAALERDIAARDDPAQRAQLLRRRTAALGEQAKRLTEQRDHTAALDLLLEEARKAGVPPGWVRNE